MSMIRLSELLKKAMVASLIFLTSSTMLLCMDPAPQEAVSADEWELGSQLDSWLANQKYAEIFHATALPWLYSQDPRLDGWLFNTATETYDVPLLFTAITRRLAKASVMLADDVESKTEYLALMMISLALAKADFACCKGLAHAQEAAVEPYDIFKKRYASLLETTFCTSVEYQDAYNKAQKLFASIDLESISLPAWASNVVESRWFNTITINSPTEYIRGVYKNSLIMSQVRNVRELSLQTTWYCFGLAESWQDFFKLSAANLVKPYGPENNPHAVQVEEDLTQSLRLVTKDATREQLQGTPKQDQVPADDQMELDSLHAGQEPSDTNPQDQQ